MELDERLLIICLVPVSAVIALVLRLVTGRRLEEIRAAPPPRIFPERPLRHAIRFKRYPSTAPLNGLPNFGLVFHIAYLAPLIMYSIMPFRERLYGFYVRLEPPGHILSEFHLPEKTLGVYVDAKSRFFLNGEPVARDNLERKLKEKLDTSLARFVYFEADKDSTFMDTAYAIDAIQGLGANVIWITPKMRAEIEEGHKRLP